jgi:transposase-like protein
MAKPNWELIKAAYITSDLSLRKTAEKFSVPFQTLAQRASREHWYQDKVASKNNVVTSAVQNAEAKQIRVATKELELLDKIEACLDKALSDVDQFNRHIVQEHAGRGKTETSEMLFSKVDMRALKDAVQALRMIHDLRVVCEDNGSQKAHEVLVRFADISSENWSA